MLAHSVELKPGFLNVSVVILESRIYGEVPDYPLHQEELQSVGMLVLGLDNIKSI